MSEPSGTLSEVKTRLVVTSILYKWIAWAVLFNLTELMQVSGSS